MKKHCRSNTPENQFTSQHQTLLSHGLQSTSVSSGVYALLKQEDHTWIPVQLLPIMTAGWDLFISHRHRSFRDARRHSHPARLTWHKDPTSLSLTSSIKSRAVENNTDDVCIKIPLFPLYLSSKYQLCLRCFFYNSSGEIKMDTNETFVNYTIKLRYSN